MNPQGRRRFLIGGLGALAPVFVLLIAVDLERHLVDANALKLAGYVVRVAALFAVGGMIAWLHETENAAFKLFEIGVGAPAVLAGLLTSGAIGPAHKPTSAASWLPIGSAHAQPNSMPAQTDIKNFSEAIPGRGSAFLEGLLGTRQATPYYVITGSYRTYDEAKAKAAAINSLASGFKADIYAPYGGNPYFAVVIGEQLPLGSAAKVRDKAVSAGLASDTYVWSPMNPSAALAASLTKQGPWAVVFGADKSLSAAQDEVAAAARKAGLNGAKIYLRNGSYRSLMIYTDRSAAEDVLGRAQTQRADAYVVDVSKWCPNAMPRDKFVECV